MATVSEQSSMMPVITRVGQFVTRGLGARLCEDPLEAPTLEVNVNLGTADTVEEIDTVPVLMASKS